MGESTTVDPVPNATSVLNPSKQKLITVSSWNIRRGLVVREQELKEIINSNAINAVFLVETDTHAINSELDYQIRGFKTVIQTKNNSALPTRIICLIDEELSDQIIIRTDLTSADFPSLWVEIENDYGKNVLCGGFYREWSPSGDRSIEAQVNAMQVFTKQIENATTERKNVIILGDANLCSLRWDSPDFQHKRISNELRETVAQCGMSHMDLGVTYTADRLDELGCEITSAIDHLYVSEELSKELV